MSLATLITSPALIDAAGHPPKRIEEYVGRASTGTSALSVARMVSLTGWSEPSQIPEFEEITVVIAGEIQAELQDEIHVVKACQALIVPAGARVRYSTPAPQGAQYISICLPAFSPDIVHRDRIIG